MKRAFDVAASGVGLVVLSPLLAVVALMVGVSSHGPIIFRQVRVGRADTRFEILKFRTMRPSECGPEVTSAGDSRITPVGAVLRATKLDELPQLVNVLRGEMSLVGPRPEVPSLARHWAPEQAAVILSVRPGITDPASIRFRDESAQMGVQDDPEAYYIDTILPEKAAMYVDYVLHRTFVGDLRLIWQTVTG
ncbi:sugar transferase [Janibacter sp. Soil728]|uniref:sugar transferase n=1 Tax=Janibacter sp. Soil728 TaxID=1736393 RepID=UPI0009E7F7E8|nr:sugar transferase [Janibacter sp. Soil728]